MDFQEFHKANMERCQDFFEHIGKDNDWTISDWATATTGELGELCNLIKKLRRGENVPTSDIGEELADTFIYLDLLADALSVNLEEAVRRKFNIVSDRVGSSIKV